MGPDGLGGGFEKNVNVKSPFNIFDIFRPGDQSNENKKIGLNIDGNYIDRYPFCNKHHYIKYNFDAILVQVESS